MRIHTMQRRDWVFLIVLSAAVAFCGVFGASYVLGQGYPYFKLWAELLLTVLATIVVAIALLFAESVFHSYKQRSDERCKISRLALLARNDESNCAEAEGDRGQGGCEVAQADGDMPRSAILPEEDEADASENPPAEGDRGQGGCEVAQADGDMPRSAILPEEGEADASENPSETIKRSEGPHIMARSGAHERSEQRSGDSGEASASSSSQGKLLETLTPRWSIASIAIFAGVMALFWLPWFIANYPGGTYWDTYYQMFQTYPENHPIAIIPWAEIYDQTLTDAWLVDHHPVFTTLVYGAFAQASDALTGNWMAGVAVFCALQGLLHIVAFTASCAYMRRVGCPLPLVFAAYAFFSIMPFISTWAMCMVKDSFFGLFYVPYFMLAFECLRTRGECMSRPRNVALFAICALMLCLTKKTGIFVVVVTAVVGIIAFRRKKPAWESFLVQGLLPAVIVCVLFPLVVFPAANIAQGGTQETLGPLFQQTARVIHDYPDDVTAEEEAAIRGVLDYDKLAEEYQFDFEDSVKYRYNLDASTQDIIRYAQAYVAMGLRHPDSYFGAAMGLAGFYVAPTAPINIRMVTVDTKMGDDQRYMLWNPDELDWLRNGLDDAYNTIAEIPVLDLPLLIVTYAFWLPALLAYVAFRNRMRCATLFAPALVLLAFCIIAPVYDARYVVPILDAAPLFLCAIVVLLKRIPCMTVFPKESATRNSRMCGIDLTGERCPKKLSKT